MANEEIAVRLEAVDQRGKSNTHRIEDLERDYQVLSRLATAVEVMATKQESMSDSVDKLAGKVDALEKVPAKRWQLVVEIVVAAVVGFLLAKIGIQ